MLLGMMLGASVATAQNALPELAPFPLEIIRTSDDCTRLDREELQKLLPMMLRTAEVTVPGSARLTTALAELQREDCNREDACLAQLSKLAGSLYAFYGQVDFDLDGNVVASGRVVRDDGRAVRGPMTVKIPGASDRFKVTAQVAIKQLLTELDVAGLSPVRALEPVLEVRAEPMTVSSTRRPWLGVGVAGIVAGAASAGVGIGFFATAGEVRTDTSQGVQRVFNEDAGKVAGIERSQAVGVTLLAAGAGLAMLGAGLILLGPVETVTTVVPTNGGAAVMMTGRLP